MEHMTSTDLKEMYGSLVKKEYLVSLVPDKKIPNTLVFESPEPFPGCMNYYSDTPQESKPLYIYFIVNENLAFDDIVRSAFKVQQKINFTFDAAFASINFLNETYKAIRVRHLDSYHQILPLQEAFANEHIEFISNERKNSSGDALIQIRKLFYLTQLSKGIYVDAIEKSHAYFVVPEKLHWDAFVTLTLQVRNNWDLSMFDAAKGYLYTEGKILDVIRIYNPKIDMAYMEALRLKYYEWMKIKIPAHQ